MCVMDIVTSCPTDLTIQDVARIAGRSVKTVRRAVHAGKLPMHYVEGARGPQLVFRPEEIERWQAQRAVTGEDSPRRGRRQRRNPVRKPPGSGPTLDALAAALTEQGSSISRLSERLAQQEARLDSAMEMLAGLAARLRVPAREEQLV